MAFYFLQDLFTPSSFIKSNHRLLTQLYFCFRSATAMLSLLLLSNITDRGWQNAMGLSLWCKGETLRFLLWDACRLRAWGDKTQYCSLALSWVRVQFSLGLLNVASQIFYTVDGPQRFLFLQWLCDRWGVPEEESYSRCACLFHMLYKKRAQD